MPLPSESIVVGVFFVLLLLGVVFLVASGSSRNRPPRRPRWQAIGYFLAGCGFLQFGLCSLLFIAISPRHDVTGSITDLSFHYGRSVSTSFTMTSEGHETPRLHIEGEAPHSIIEGETATVRYVEYDHQVTDLRMLSGRAAGWAFHSPDGPGFSLILSLGGAGFLYASFRTRREYGVTLLGRQRT